MRVKTWLLLGLSVAGLILIGFVAIATFAVVVVASLLPAVIVGIGSTLLMIGVVVQVLAYSFMVLQLAWCMSLPRLLTLVVEIWPWWTDLWKAIAG